MARPMCLDGNLVPAHLMGDHAEKMEGVGVIRIGLRICR